MEQLILHLVGDYVTQSDWMANEKTKRSLPALWHAFVYSAPFLFIGSPLAVFVIFATHFVIDRWRLARFVCWAKNQVFSPFGGMFEDIVESRAASGDAEAAKTLSQIQSLKWVNCSSTGYPSERPAWLTVWLLIACDNTLHLAINYAALRWL